jgi:hypothetical protein
MKQVELLKLKLEKSELEKETFKQRFEKLKKLKGGFAITCDIFEVTCNLGHPLKKNERLDGSRLCDRCSIPIGLGAYYKCNVGCDYI